MEPRIIFLGTGGESLVTARQLRACGGIIIQTDSYQFHIDPGPGSLVKAAEYDVNLRDNTAIVVSKNDLLHCGDINAVIDSMTYTGLDKKGVLICNKTLVEGTEKIKPYLQDFYSNCLERTIALSPGQRVGIEHIEIRALKAENSDPNALGFKFFTPRFVLSYSSDTKYKQEIVEAYKNSDILILNVTNPAKIKSDGLNSEDAIRIIEKVKPHLAIITHFGVKMLKADPINEAREISKRTGVQVIAAKDGLQVNPISYSVQLKQKTLLGF